jgi:hypothetical protein
MSYHFIQYLIRVKIRASVGLFGMQIDPYTYNHELTVTVQKTKLILGSKFIIFDPI